MLPATLTTHVVADDANIPSGTISIDSSYAAVRIGANDTLYRSASSTLADPRTLRVSHEYSASGDIVNSAIILKQEVTDPVTKKTGFVQVTLKVTRDDSLVTKNDVLAAMLEIGSIVAANTSATPATVTDASGASLGSNLSLLSFMNGEH